MSLISFEYFFLLLITVIAYYLSPKRIRWVILLVASYIFYYLSSTYLIIFLLLSTISIYLCGIFLGKEQSRLEVDIPKEEKSIVKKSVKKRSKLILLLTIVFNFGLLGVLKYLGFFTTIINSFIHLFSPDTSLPIMKFVLPLGISYYTLSAISYVVDIYRGKIKASKNLGHVALFTSFFPQITEGPIARYADLTPQLTAPHNYEGKNISLGVSMITMGLLKKMVIADRAAIFVNTIFASSEGGFLIFVAAILYTLQIYAEFSGCMDIVLGSSKLFGISLTPNFRQPFFSKNIQEFWQRWHITLGAWIKEYIFYPISLSKMSTKVTMTARKYLRPSLGKFIAVAFPLLFVWLFNGIWHGASIKYVSYGLYYYTIMMLGLLVLPFFSNISKRIPERIRVFMQILRTCFFVVIGMMLFRSTSLTHFFTLINHIFTTATDNLFMQGLTEIDFIILLGFTIILYLIGLYQEKGYDIYERFYNSHLLTKYFIYFLVVVFIIIFGIYGPGYNVSDFIYGAF